MARTPYVKNYETVEDIPSEDTPYGATQLQNIEDSISGIDTDLAILEAILGVSTDTFDDEATYAVDDFVIYQNKLWRCTTAVTVAGAWTGATNWVEDSILVSS